MALPTRGQPDWDDELNNHISGMEADIQSAKSNASAAISNANEARDVAQSVRDAVLGGTDVATAGFINDNASETAQALTATIGTGIANGVTPDQLGAHLYVDYVAGIYLRDRQPVSAASAITHNTTGTKPYRDLNPSTSNDVRVVASGVTGTVGLGGSLPAGWTLVNPSGTTVKVHRASGDAPEIELEFTLPAGQTVGFTSPNITGADNTRQVSVGHFTSATDLYSIAPRIGWETGTAHALLEGGGGHLDVLFAGSSSATDKLYFRWTNTSATDVLVQCLVKDIACYVPASSNQMRKNVQPFVYDSSTLGARDITVHVAPGSYHVFAWTEGRGVVPANVTVTAPATSFDLRSAIGNGRVSRIAVWKSGTYRHGLLDAIEPPAWEEVHEFDTGRLQKMGPYIFSAGKLHLQGADQPWSLAHASNRFMRQRAEVRSGDYLPTDTQAGTVYSHIYQARSEVYSNVPWLYDTDYWASWSMRTSAVNSDPNFYGIIFQALDTPNAGDSIVLSPSLSLQLRQNSQLMVVTSSTTDANPSTQPAFQAPWLGTYVPDEWNHIVLRMRFSQSGGGKLGIWFNGAEVFAWQDHALGYNKVTGPKIHWGYYGTQPRVPTQVERANFEYGTTDLSARITNPLPV